MFVFETGSHYVAQAVLTLNLQSSCLSFPRAGITGVNHHVQLRVPFFQGSSVRFFSFMFRVCGC
jgi:hypothetical protein